MAKEADQPGRKVDLQSKRRAEKLGDQLRQLYDSVAQESVPDEFMRLLEEADKAKSSSQSKR